ncbi:pyridoxamine 5'-phosphate oxidase family protein [Acidobacteriota bacterium]
MRRKDKEILDQDEIYRIIQKARYCRVAFCDGERPYVLPFNYGYANGALYIHCAPEGRKIAILKKNNRVCFQLDTDVQMSEGEIACGWSVKYRSVIGNGTCQIIQEAEGLKEGLKILMAQYSDKQYEITDKDLKGVVLLKIEIDEVTGKQSGF